ncbi:MAG: hypothetical protein ISS31_01215 [Kiritimatiellae bacterium]|nr:hypothetical protein [Kiritimatiellia bacterium]
MKHTKIVLGTLLLTLLVWGYTSWPLAGRFGSGIPAAHHSSEVRADRAMIAGDHLQFLYHLWLAKDTFCGPTPLFYNTYEFNTGDDEARKDTGKRYYLPFSLLFILGALGGNQALGWNLMGLVALWLTALFTWMLARRYTPSGGGATLAALVAIAFPYRWFTLMGGSPTGLAMMWVPMIYYGLDVAIRDHKPWGAILAGAALSLSEWSDPHITFFAGLTTPFWCVLSYIHHHRGKWLPTAREIRSYVIALSPLLLFGLLMVWQARRVQVGLQATAIGDKARPILDVAINSPAIRGAFTFDYIGVHSQIYTGYLSAALLVVGLFILLATTIYRWRMGEDADGRACLVAVLLGLAVVGIVVLALGTKNPGGERAWRLLTRVLPPYGKIRQPAKIFAILPVLLAMAYALALPPLLRKIVPQQRVRAGVWSVIAAALLFDYAHHTNPVISLLDREQGAYAAIAEDADTESYHGHLLAIPLWPGNSHWSSLNQYYVSLYRLRMVNGYRPTPRTDYQDYIRQFESFNKGSFDHAQLAELQERGIHYLVLHENAFPEKVSPFAVSDVLHKMLAHPRLALLAQDGPVWAFKIVPAPQGVYAELPDWRYDFPCRLWQGERSLHEGGEILPSFDDKTSANYFLRLPGPKTQMTLHEYPILYSPGLCYLVRMRGTGGCRGTVLQGGTSQQPVSLALTDTWEWYTVPIAAFTGYPRTSLQLTPERGRTDIDLVILATDTWPVEGLTQPLDLPAALFFHAGHIDLESGAVVLDPDREPADYIFYGPKLPLPAGQYRITIDYESPAPAGTKLASVRARYPSGHVEPPELIAGTPAEFTYDLKTNLRLSIDLGYTRAAPLRVKSVVIAPVPEED